MLSQILLAVFALAALLAGLYFARLFSREGERRAASLGWLTGLAAALALGLAVLLPEALRLLVLVGLALGALALGIAFFLPGRKIDLSHDVPLQQVDERDTIFARARLRAGSPEHEAYYALRPENQPGDDHTRRLPGLLSPQASLADPLLFAAPFASFTMTEAMHAVVEGEPAPVKTSLPPGQMTVYIKSLASYFGALEVGVTGLQPYHL